MDEYDTSSSIIKPDISVIMTVRNGGEFVEESVLSALQQKNISHEVIVVDDGSEDNTIDVLQKLSNNEGKLRIIKQPPIGRGATLNIAWQSAKGEYIANLDADDISHPQRLAVQFKIMKNNSWIDVLTGLSSIFTEKIPDFLYNPIDLNSNKKVNLINSELALYNPITHSAVMIRRQMLEQVGGYNEARQTQLDYDLWVRIALNNGSLARLPIPIVAKRVHSKQSFQQRQRIYYLYSSFKIRLKAINFLELPKNRVWYYLIAILSFIYGLIPTKIRIRFRKFIPINKNK